MDHSSEHSPSESGAAGSPVDLSQFHQIFFEEAAENLDQLEQLLLSLDLKAADDEELNALFRCAHSIKGGAATFGFADMAQLTHHMESLLDGLRRHEVQASVDMVDALLAAADTGRAMLGAHQGGRALELTNLQQAALAAGGGAVA